MDKEISQYMKIRNRLAKYVQEQCAEADGWMEWPSVRDLAKRYRLGQDIIIGMIEEIDEIDLIVGFRNDSGYGSFDIKGDYRAEWYGG